jgi:O-antigen/teichoic acid export membrane protein
MTSFRKSLFKDGAWVSLSQVLIVLSQLMAVRVLTEFMSPSEFGNLSLWLGASALILMMTSSPSIEALTKFYPEYFRLNQGRAAVAAVRLQVLKIGFYALPLLAITLWLILKPVELSPLLLILILCLAILEYLRAERWAILKSMRKQKELAVWGMLDALFRLSLATLLLTISLVSVELVLFSYILATALICAYYWLKSTDKGKYKLIGSLPEDKKRIWQYTLPLIPLGLFGWLSGMADRYIIAGFLDVSDLGIYVAIYGLASRPVLMFGGIVSTTFRPAYQNLVLDDDLQRQAQVLKHWYGILIVGSIFGLALSILCSELIVKIFLGKSYWIGSHLIPILVLGYSFLILSHISTNVLYVHGETKKVLILEVFSTLIALTAAAAMVQQIKLYGASLAVVIGFFAQWCMSLFFARRYIFNIRESS